MSSLFVPLSLLPFHLFSVVTVLVTVLGKELAQLLVYLFTQASFSGRIISFRPMPGQLFLASLFLF